MGTPSVGFQEWGGAIPATVECADAESAAGRELALVDLTKTAGRARPAPAPAPDRTTDAETVEDVECRLEPVVAVTTGCTFTGATGAEVGV